MANVQYLVWTDDEEQKHKEPITDTTELLTAIEVLSKQGLKYTVEE